MPDLKDQIRTYYEATTEPVDVDAVIVESGTVLVGPFPDAAQRRAGMKTAPEKLESSLPHRPWWRGPVAAVAAFVSVVVLGVSLVFLGLRGDDRSPADPPTTTTDAAPATSSPTTPTTAPPPTTASPELSSEQELATKTATVENMLAAWNDADLDLVQSLLTDAPTVFGSRMSTDADWDATRAFMAADQRWELLGPCEDIVGPSIQCPILRTDEFTRPAGVSPEAMQATFRVTDDGLISFFEVSGGDEISKFLQAFDAWLLDSYPEVHATFGERPFFRMPDAQDMPTALQYVEEFVAQSDVYPLSP